MKFNKLLTALALVAIAPLAHAGDTFVNAQVGTAKLSDTGYDDTRAGMGQLSIGHRWGVGPVHVGVEIGGGYVNPLRDDYFYADGSEEHYRLKTSYGFIGANARADLPATPIYFTGRLGYMGYNQSEKYRYYDASTGQYGGYDDSNNNSGGMYYGVGVGWTVLPTLSLSLNYTGLSYAAMYNDGNGNYSWGDTKTGHATTLGAEFRF